MNNRLVFLLIICILFSSLTVVGLDKTVKQIDADILRNNFDLSGQNVKICVIDSGIDKTNRYLEGKIVAEKCFCSFPEGEYDYCCPNHESEDDEATNTETPHGTQVAGIIASQHETYKGIAPEAELYLVKAKTNDPKFEIYNFQKKQFWNDVGQGIDWCIEQNVDIITISITIDDRYSSLFCPTGEYLNRQLNDAIESEIIVIAATGNEDNINSVAYPACDPRVISVGSVTDKDIIKDNRFNELDLLAPGGDLEKDKTYADPDHIYPCNPEYDSLICTSGISPSLSGVQGTSMAAPHVAASAALLIEAFDHNVEAERIEEALINSGDIIDENAPLTLDILRDLQTYGRTFPRVNPHRALYYLMTGAEVLRDDWMTYRHDNYRTGFTLLKGNLDSFDSGRKDMNYVVGTRDDDVPMAYARPSIGDIDGDKKADLVMTYSLKSAGHGVLEVFEKDDNGNTQSIRWADIGTAVSIPPTIGDIDHDGDNDIVVGLDTGQIKVFENENKFVMDEMEIFTVPEQEPYGENYTSQLATTTVADLDNDGKNEVLFADLGIFAWEGHLFKLEYKSNGDIDDSKTVMQGLGNDSRGTRLNAALAVANIDDDTNLEVVVPSLVGLQVYDYDNGEFSLKCNNSHAEISGTPIIYDINRDGDYEIIYPTINFERISGQNLDYYNKLYIVDANDCKKITGFNFESEFMTETAVGIANFDNDASMEIVVVGYVNNPDNGQVKAFQYNGDSVDLTEEWTYPESGYMDLVRNAPNIVDINGKDYYEIILSTTGTSITILESESGERFEFKQFVVEGPIGSTPIVGDVNGDGVAEITVQRAGSPLNVITSIAGNNKAPVIHQPSNTTMYAKVGDLININKSGEIWATDENNDSLYFYYSKYFNESGLYLADENSTGAHVITVLASDGNLTDEFDMYLEIFSENHTFENTFANGETSIQKTIDSNVVMEFEIHYHKDKINDKTRMKVTAK